MDITKAVIPAAGLGTRFLPATKAVPKELLPIVDTPTLEYVVAEAAAAGLGDVLLVTGRGKDALADHFDRAPALEAALEAKGDAERLRAVRRSAELAAVHQVRQAEPLGLGHAVLCAAEHVGAQPFAVLLGDDVIDPRDALLAPMLAVQRLAGGSVVALMPVPREQISLYGAARVVPAAAGLAAKAGVAGEDVVAVTELVEKPAPAEAPSDLAVIGRYVLHPAVFKVLAEAKPGRGGEIQLTDAIDALARTPAAEGGGVSGVVFRGRRYDAGDKLEYLKATVRLAVEREDLGPAFGAWLRSFVAAGGAG
ncbi:MAG: UTP--glucose-1-phosphate uridylyltransferase [Bifidobacteriaceae bacterium]|jgi:UTP--glucose-1-phosphate uridylyltransferase|nr:UTP--glucose-1-phosphate uridylyltransferase [Bifidobacteriaceae bacterium]